MLVPEPVNFDDIWMGQLISEPGNPKKYRVISIRNNPDQVVVRAVGGTNMRTIVRESLEIAWFPAGALPAEN